ncbi:hypothetical protein ACUNV4_29640 [Granulosicoccus sp. 3-233]|uniref:hypothetical protein n=1 Tax=Granulosicoccus sp. 3-233 TaxID=3417969 RepID=UPI003D345398
MTQVKESEFLKRKITELGPWHHKVVITPDISTQIGSESESRIGSEGTVVLIDDKQEFVDLLGSIYPDGVSGRSFLEAACNCAAYSNYFMQLGGEKAFGFDAREHWVNQANFLKKHLLDDTEAAQFRVADLEGVKSIGLDNYDIGMFKGIFYHLPDPISSLKTIADLTNEVLIFNSASRYSPRSGLVLAREDTSHLMSGIYGLNWFPTDPAVIEKLLQTMGFNDFRVLFWHKRPSIRNGMKRGVTRFLKNTIVGNGRFGLIAARKKGFFDHFDTTKFTAKYNNY